MLNRSIEEQLHNWELYKAYGHFNLCFESIIAAFRGFTIEMVRRYYGFDVDWEDPETEAELDDHLQDRLLKIILHDDGANAIVEKCRSCFNDMDNPVVIKTLAENDVQPFRISDNIRKAAGMIFKSASELVRLRNIIIHSHYEGIIFDLNPPGKLKGKKEVRVSKGIEERAYKFNAEYLNNTISQMEELYVFIERLKLAAPYESDTDTFSPADMQTMEKFRFDIARV